MNCGAASFDSTHALAGVSPGTTQASAPAALSGWTPWTSAGLGVVALFTLLGLRRRNGSRRVLAPWLALVLGLTVGAAVIGHSAECGR